MGYHLRANAADVRESENAHGRFARVGFGYRFYSPELGRWINRDPIEEDGGLSLYGFVMNNAIMFIDPHGLASWRLIRIEGPNNCASKSDIGNEAVGIFERIESEQSHWIPRLRGMRDPSGWASTAVDLIKAINKKAGFFERIAESVTGARGLEFRWVLRVIGHGSQKRVCVEECNYATNTYEYRWRYEERVIKPSTVVWAETGDFRPLPTHDVLRDTLKDLFGDIRDQLR